MQSVGECSTVKTIPFETIDSQIHVVVPTMGTRPQWLRQALLSVARQRGVILQIVIVIPSGGDVSPADGIDCVKVKREDRPGLSAAINSGMESTNAEYVTWLGDDDLLAPDSLYQSISLLRLHPGAPFSYGRTRYIDAGGATIGLTRPSSLAARSLKYGNDFIPQPGSVVRRSAWQAVGGVDENLRNAMDLKLFLDLSRLGHPIYLKREVSAFRIHPESITLTKNLTDESEAIRRSYQGSNATRTYAMWRPVVKVADKWVDRVFRLAPCPAPELVNGGPYTSAEF